MGLASTLNTLADIIDPTQAYWSIRMRNGKTWSQHSLIPTNRKGQKGFRLLDWGNDIVSTGDIGRIAELKMHCPNGAPTAVLEISEGMWPFQFVARSMEMLGGNANKVEYMVIGRILDLDTGQAECFVWDYRPTPQMTSNLLALNFNFYTDRFGYWRDTVTPMGTLSMTAQGLQL